MTCTAPGDDVVARLALAAISRRTSPFLPSDPR